MADEDVMRYSKRNLDPMPKNVSLCAIKAACRQVIRKNVEPVEQVRNRTGLHSAFNATWLYSQGLAQACHRFRLMRGMLSRSLLRLKHAGKKLKKLQFKREVSKKWSGISEGKIACVNVWWWNVWCEVNTMWTWYGPWHKKICVLFDAQFFSGKKGDMHRFAGTNLSCEFCTIARLDSGQTDESASFSIHWCSRNRNEQKKGNGNSRSLLRLKHAGKELKKTSV